MKYLFDIQFFKCFLYLRHICQVFNSFNLRVGRGISTGGGHVYSRSIMGQLAGVYFRQLKIRSSKVGGDDKNIHSICNGGIVCHSLSMKELIPLLRDTYFIQHFMSFCMVFRQECSFWINAVKDLVPRRIVYCYCAKPQYIENKTNSSFV